MGFPGSTVVKNLPADEGDTGDRSSIPVGLGGGGGREKIPWSRKWQLTPIFLPEKFHGQRSPVGYSPWGRKESDMTEHRTIARVYIIILKFLCLRIFLFDDCHQSSFLYLCLKLPYLVVF